MKPEQKYIDAGIYKRIQRDIPWLDEPVPVYVYDLEKLNPLFREFFWWIGNISDQKYNIEKRSFERFEAEYDQHEYIDYLKEERKKALHILNEKKKWLVPYENKSIINFIAEMGDEYLMGYFTKSEASPIYFDKLEVYRDLIEAETARKLAEYLKQRIEAYKPIQDKQKKRMGRPPTQYKKESDFIQARYVTPVSLSLNEFLESCEYLLTEPHNTIKATVSAMETEKVFKKRIIYWAILQFFADKYGVDAKGFTDAHKNPNKAAPNDIYEAYYNILKSKLNGSN